MKDLFEDLIGTPPASTVDVIRIMARQNRLTMLRRAIGAALAVAVITGGIAIIAKPPVRNGRIVASPSPMQSPSAVPEGAEAKAARVEAAWKRALTTVLPTAQWREGHDGSRETPSRADYYDAQYGPNPPRLSVETNAEGWKMVPWHTSDMHYTSFGIVKVGAVASGMFFTTSWRKPGALLFERCTTDPDGVVTCQGDFTCFQGGSCRHQTGPNGEKLFITYGRNEIDEWNYPELMITVQLFSADNSRFAQLFVTNRPGSDAFPGPKGTAHALTEQQMIDILLEPGLLI